MLFPDDSNALITNKSLHDLKQKVERLCIKLEEGSSANKLTINIDKTDCNISPSKTFCRDLTHWT